MQNILKGIEISLPEGVTFTDPDGNVRTRMRTRWWLNAGGKTYGELTFRENEEVADVSPRPEEAARLTGYDGRIPVFFGHYWFRGEPSIITSKVACLDYSVAKGGFLTAYTWRGEKELANGGFTTV